MIEILTGDEWRWFRVGWFVALVYWVAVMVSQLRESGLTVGFLMRHLSINLFMYVCLGWLWGFFLIIFGPLMIAVNLYDEYGHKRLGGRDG